MPASAPQDLVAPWSRSSLDFAREHVVKSLPDFSHRLAPEQPQH